MKAIFNTRQQSTVNGGRGRWYVNMNEEIKTYEDNGDTVYEYVYDQVLVDGYPTYPKVVDLLIRERYTISDELAIHRQRDNKPHEFSEYNAFCEACKDMARPVFNISGGE